MTRTLSRNRPHAVQVTIFVWNRSGHTGSAYPLKGELYLPFSMQCLRACSLQGLRRLLPFLVALWWRKSIPGWNESYCVLEVCAVWSGRSSGANVCVIDETILARHTRLKVASLPKLFLTFDSSRTLPQYCSSDSWNWDRPSRRPNILLSRHANERFSQPSGRRRRGKKCLNQII